MRALAFLLALLAAPAFAQSVPVRQVSSASITPTVSCVFKGGTFTTINGLFSIGGTCPPLTVARASNATYFDSTGALQTASSNVPRLDYDPATLLPRGLLLEGQGTNIFLNSQSPVTQTVTTTAQSYTISFYGTGTIVLSGTATGTLTGTSSTALASTTKTATAGALVLTVSGSVANAQVEAGLLATSRIITTGTSATRSADKITAPTAGWWNPAGGSMRVTSLRLGYPGVTAVDIDIATDGNNRIDLLGWNSYSNQALLMAVAGSYNQGIAGPIAYGTPYKQSMSVQGSTYLSAVNSSATLMLIKALPRVTTLQFGNDYNMTDPCYCWVQDFEYTPTVLNSSQLQQWVR